MNARRNHQIVLARRPTGAVSEACFESTVRDVPELGEGEALLQVRYLGIDPTIRGWLDEHGNYMPGVAIGECVRSNGVGVVVETNNPDEYPLGRVFMHLTGWQEYCVLQPKPFPPITRIRIEDWMNNPAEAALNSTYEVRNTPGTSNIQMHTDSMSDAGYFASSLLQPTSV